MLSRYTRPEMRELWVREETKFEYWLQVELAFLWARESRGDIPRGVYEAIQNNAVIDVYRINEIEEEVQHDMIAFVKMIQEGLQRKGIGQYAAYFHQLLTSYNVEDPAMILMLRKALDLIDHELAKLRDALLKKANEHKNTYMIMRTHGQFAEPSTFGHLLLVYERGIQRAMNRINLVMENELSDGNISGAVGSYGEIDPALEAIALKQLGLNPAMAETQILQRDRHAFVLSALATAGGTIEQMMRTFWEMMRLEVGELQEPRSAKQRGSSAMAHKKNPIKTEQLQGMPRLLRGSLVAAMENIATPEGRDISQSCVERHIFPDATSQLHYMAVAATKVVEGLVVFPHKMKENLEIGTHGTWAGQPVRTALMKAGIDYDTAYLYVQEASFAAMQSQRPLLNLLMSRLIPGTDSKTALDVLGEGKLRSCFKPEDYVGKGVDHIFHMCR